MPASPALPCNLLVSYDAQHGDAAESNVRAVLAEVGTSPRFLPGASPGVFQVFVPTDSRGVVRRARDLCLRDPSMFARTHRWWPVDAWVASDLPSMRDAVGHVGKGIREGETWRLTLDIHGPSPYHRRDLVVPLTEPVRRGRVRLHEPAKVLRVDLLRSEAAVALLARGDELSVEQVREEGMRVPQET